ncbi:hypothetical protein F4212_08605 [Candidatus Poribacteria bacterium]|nr:hypothetical protein [Candidatus Poribacteria bacterium]
MGSYIALDNAVSERDELESKLDDLQTLIDILDPHDRKLELWDVPDEEEQIEDLGGDLDDTVGKALKKAKALYAELEFDYDELNSEISIREGILGIE